MSRALALAVLVIAAAPARADCLVDGGEADVAAVSGLTLTLRDGRMIALADVRAAEPGAEGALRPFVGRRVRLREASPPRADRWGRIIGDVVPLDPGGESVPLDAGGDPASKDTATGLRLGVIARGVALVDPVDMSAPCLADLFGAERTAEANRRGVWREPPILSAAADGLAQGSGRYVLVDGTVASVGETKQTLYLDFGTDWRTDFTAMIRRRDASAWGLDVSALLQRPVRVRGVLEAWNGGLIRIEHPAQIELR